VAFLELETSKGEKHSTKRDKNEDKNAFDVQPFRENVKET
jgi:hypothetical protein